ncbi:hypothetical protein [Novosphingobium soli]|uniref:hypothetical protein n=1 Tax=Novosphingobium soli TaxID=574956 RepID=UPI00362F982D
MVSLGSATQALADVPPEDELVDDVEELEPVEVEDEDDDDEVVVPELAVEAELSSPPQEASAALVPTPASSASARRRAIMRPAIASRSCASPSPWPVSCRSM